jgi:hypothetical protein
MTLTQERELTRIYNRSYRKYLRRMSAARADEAAAKIIYKVLSKRKISSSKNEIVSYNT